MANRMFIPPLGHLEVGVVKLYCKMTIAGSGAVTLVSASSKGIASVTLGTTGKYTIALTDTYNSLLHATYTLLDDTNSDPATVGVFLRTFSEDVASGTAPAVVMQSFAGDDGAAANPASGATITVELTLKNSSV